MIYPTVRKSKRTDRELELLKKHPLFSFESPGTLTFKSLTHKNDRDVKKELTEYLAGFGVKLLTKL